MHDEHDGSGAAATGIAAIAFADADDSFMLLQFKHCVLSVVRRFPWEEKSSHVHQSGPDGAKLATSESFEDV